MSGFELTTSVVIDTDCTASGKSNYIPYNHNHDHDNPWVT